MWWACGSGSTTVAKRNGKPVCRLFAFGPYFVSLRQFMCSVDQRSAGVKLWLLTNYSMLQVLYVCVRLTRLSIAFDAVIFMCKSIRVETYRLLCRHYQHDAVSGQFFGEVISCVRSCGDGTPFSLWSQPLNVCANFFFRQFSIFLPALLLLVIT